MQTIRMTSLEDLERMKSWMTMVRHLSYKGLWPTAKETLELLQKVYQQEKDFYAEGGYYLIPDYENIDESSQDGE